jgi:hypothetical protein
MGVAVIAKTDLFRASDFRRNRRPPVSTPSLVFTGYFASLGHVNTFLQSERGRQAPKRSLALQARQFGLVRSERASRGDHRGP